MPEIIEQIRECTKCNLRNLVCKSFGKRDTFNTFCFYYSEAEVREARFIMIMQNPGQGTDYATTDENIELIHATSNNFIEINQKYLLKWLRGKNKAFIKPFINKLKEHGLVSYSFSEDGNYENSLLKDFLFTDVVKCRATTSETKEYVDTCFNNYLVHELKLFGENKLIFVFGTRAWTTIYKHDEFVDKTKSDNHKQMHLVSQAHGFLFPSKIPNTFFIPLSHFSQTQFNKFLRNSYFDYLEQGLKQYSEQK